MSASAPSTTAALTPAAASPSLPSAQTLLQAAKVAMEQDKPVLLDYYADSCVGKAFLGVDENTEEKMLVKSSDEYTSLVQKVYKVGEDFLVLTENSIYIVSGKLSKRKIQASSYLGNE
jgi:hypothetical protein